jgi:MSHA biogenesis protein MshP
VSRARQGGFGLVGAVFLITTVSVTAAAAVSTLTARARVTPQNLEAIRAYHAARSAVEIGLAGALGGGCGAVPATLALEGFDVTLACSAAGDDEAGETVTVYRVTATAASGSFTGGSFVSRTVRGSASAP